MHFIVSLKSNFYGKKTRLVGFDETNIISNKTLKNDIESAIVDSKKTEEKQK